MRGFAEGATARWSLLILPALAALGVFFVYPLGLILARSFTDFVGTESGLDNFRWFFEERTNLEVLVRTFTTALSVTAVCIVLGYPYAYLMSVASARWRAVLLAVVLVPFWTSVLVRTYAWVILLQDEGPIQDAFSAAQLGRPELIRTSTGVTIGMAQTLLPLFVLPLYANLRGIDRRLLDAAAGLGATPRIAFLKVYLPLSAPGVASGALLVFVTSLGFYLTPALLGSPSDSLLSQLIQRQIGALLAWGRAGTAAVILLLATLLCLAVAARLGGRMLSAYGVRAEKQG